MVTIFLGSFYLRWYTLVITGRRFLYARFVEWWRLRWHPADRNFLNSRLFQTQFRGEVIVTFMGNELEVTKLCDTAPFGISRVTLTLGPTQWWDLKQFESLRICFAYVTISNRLEQYSKLRAVGSCILTGLESSKCLESCSCWKPRKSWSCWKLGGLDRVLSSNSLGHFVLVYVSIR